MRDRERYDDQVWRLDDDAADRRAPPCTTCGGRGMIIIGLHPKFPLQPMTRVDPRAPQLGDRMPCPDCAGGNGE